MWPVISHDFYKFQIHILAYYDHFRLHLGLCVVFAYSFAYHRGWNAYLEVWGEIQGLYCKVWKFWVHCDVNKNPGTKVANS